MHPRFRTFLNRSLALIALVLGLHGELRAQAFSLEANSIDIATFFGQYYSMVDVALKSDDPAFIPGSLNINNNTSWLGANINAERRVLRVYCYYDNGIEATAKITVRTATHTSTLTVNRRCFAAYRSPKTLLSADKTRIYALYQDAVLMLDARTQHLLASARLAPPPGITFSSDGGRVLSFSEDQTQLRVFISGCPLLFRLSPVDLASLGPLSLPPLTALAAQRVFAGEKAGKLYFVRYGSALNSADGAYSYYYPKHYQSTIDVVSAVSGALLQSYTLPAAEQTTTIDDLAIHPTRDETWIRERRRTSYYTSSVWLRRLSLDAAGLVQTTLGSPQFLQDLSYYAATDQWSESSARTLLRSGASYAISPPFVFDATSEPPTALSGKSSYATLLSRGNIAAGAYGVQCLDTGESLSSSALKLPGEYNDPTIVGLSEDGLDLIAVQGDYGIMLPRVHFLPAAFAAQASNQARVPVDGQMTAPPAALSWYALPGAAHYRVYLSTTASDLTDDTTSASHLLGESDQASLDLSTALAAGKIYYWRVDAVYGDRLVTGTVQSFSVSAARVENQPCEIATVAGARRRDFSLPIVTSAADTTWKIVSEVPWISVRSGSGARPGVAEFSVDAQSLAGGDHDTVVWLVTSDGSVPITLKFRVQAPAFNQAVVRPGFARLLAIGPSVVIKGAVERLLFTVDTESEQILRCVSVPSTTLPFTSSLLPSCPAPGSPLYVPASGNSIGEFDPESLELKRVVQVPALAGEPAPIRFVGPAGDERLWILGNQHTLARLNAAGTAYDLELPALACDQSMLSADGRHVYTFTRNWHYDYGSRSFTLKRYDLEGSALSLSAEKTLPYPSNGYYYDSPQFGLNPARLSYLGVIYDENLDPIPAIDDSGLALAASGACAFGGALVYLGEDLSDVRILPPGMTFYGGRHYDAVSGKVIYFDSSTIRFTSVDTLPAVTDSALKAVKVTDVDASFAWERAPATGGWQNYYLITQLAYRPAGSDQPWTLPYAYYYSSMGLSYLAPETAYEVRARISNSAGVLSRWSDTLAFTTAIARPAHDYSSWPYSTTIQEGSSLPLELPVTGESLTWNVTGLPPGLSFNSDTRRFEGSATTSGRYAVEITVSNAGGSFTHSIYLNVAASTSANTRARYSGLQRFAEDPLVGDWRATRSGDIVTGYVRTFAGGSSFKIRLPAVSEPYLLRSKEFKIRISGVNVYAGFAWDTLTDQCSLSLSFYEYGSSTLGETGRGVSYDKYFPHPFTGRFTGIAAGEPAPVPEYRVPEGAGLLRLDVEADGGVSIAAETALGQRFTTHTSIARDGAIPVFSPQDGYHIWGLLQMDRSLVPAQPRFAGSLDWTKYTNRQASFYRQGFAHTLTVLGAPLPATGKNRPPLAPLANEASQAGFRLSGGGLDRLSKPIRQILVPTSTGFTAPQAGTAENPNRVSVKLDAKTGIATGSAAILDSNAKKILRTQSFRGMFVKDPLGDGRDVIGGYFHLPDGRGAKEAGLLEILEVETDTPDSSAP